MGFFDDFKPDGTPALDVAGDFGNIGSGAANLLSGTADSFASWDLDAGGFSDAFQSISSLAQSFGAGPRFPGGPPYPNILEMFASYTPLWTLACLTPEQFNDPSLYRGIPGALTEVVFSSAGRYDEVRTRTVGGQPEYYVNNFSMDQSVSPSQAAGLSNVIKFEFEVYEPYSMGYFLQSLQAAAINQGYPNHNGTPFVLKLEFAGNTDDGGLYGSEAALEKYFVIQIINVTFTTNEGGSTYKVTATPKNHSGFSSVNGQIMTDIKITGEDVKEMLVSGEQSLCVALNRAQKKLVDSGQRDVPDEYLVVFPENWADKIGVENGTWLDNEDGEAVFDPLMPIIAPLVGRVGAASEDYGNGPVGLSSMGFSATDGGNYNFGLEGDVTDESTGLIQRGILKIDPKQRTFNYSKGASIQNIIQSVVLSSDYAKAAIDPKNLTETGHIKWFRVDVQQKIGELDLKRNVRASRFIFRVLPFMVHSSIFRNPTSGPAKGFEKLDALVAKEYNYIYTGKNNDVIKFDITINNLFNVGKPVAPPQNTETAANPDTQQSAEDPDQKVKSDDGGNTAATANEVGGTSSQPDFDATKPSVVGGRGARSVEEIVALAMQNAILKGTGDLININLEIIGDPFWITDNGLGNYIGDSYDGPDSQITRDQTLNYQGTDSYFRIIFRTPIEPGVLDGNQVSGLYVFPDGETENPYSGIYRVVKLNSKFSDGTFKQTLNATRLNPQPKDIPGGPRVSAAPFNLDASETDTISTSPNDGEPSWNDAAAEDLLMSGVEDPFDPAGYDGPDGESVGS